MVRYLVVACLAACVSAYEPCHLDVLPVHPLLEATFDDRGDSGLNSATTYSYNLPATSGGYEVDLTGWTHTRSYAKGFLRNKAGDATATVKGLTAGEVYHYQLMQYASSFKGTNTVSVNGGDAISVHQTSSTAATASGSATANAQGEIVFTFARVIHHVHLSGISITQVTKQVDHSNDEISLLSENNFNDKGSAGLNTASTFTYHLSEGYEVDLTGWSHTRSYAKGFIRNGAGSSAVVPTATVKNLQPHATYQYALYQYASSFKNLKNRVAVNGGAWITTTQTNSDDATLSGTATANANGEVVFTFGRDAWHVHLSGIGFKLVNCHNQVHTNTKCSEGDDRVFKVESGMTLESCKIKCEDTAGCEAYSFAPNGQHAGMCMGCKYGFTDGHDGFNFYELDDEHDHIETNTKCSEGDDRVFKVESGMTLNSCKAKCEDTAGCQSYSFAPNGQHAGMCMGCKHGFTDGHDGFDFYNVPCRMQCTVGADDIITVTHDATSGHASHRCYINDDDECTCQCF